MESEAVFSRGQGRERKSVFRPGLKALFSCRARAASDLDEAEGGAHGGEQHDEQKHGSQPGDADPEDFFPVEGGERRNASLPPPPQPPVPAAAPLSALRLRPSRARSRSMAVSFQKRGVKSGPPVKRVA